MFKTRLISGVVLVILAILFINTGGDLLLSVLLIISLIGMGELYKTIGIHNNLPGVIGYLAAAGYYGIIRFTEIKWVLLLIFAFLIVIMAAYVFSFPKYNAEQITLAFFGVFYVAMMMSCIYLARNLPDGRFLVWLIFFSAWGCDTCAYCVGILFGKHKLAPKLSPKKSIEGSIGGIVGAALLGLIYAACVNHFSGFMPGRMWKYPLICGLGAIIAQIGDLAASGIKRNHNVKDYGKLIPGHGGILDRFDSVIFTAPVIYFLGVFLSLVRK